MRVVASILFAAFIFVSAPAAAEPQLSLGFLSSAAGQGVIVYILQETNILKLVGLDVQFFDISPASMAEAIAAKRLDVEIIGDLPMATQVAAGFPVKIVAFLWDFRHAIITNNPAIQSLTDLRGRKLGTPFGTTAYLDARQNIAAAGLDPEKTIELINIAPPNVALAIRSKDVDAVCIWDPIRDVLEQEGMRPLVTIDHTGYTVSTMDFIKNQPDAMVRFLEAQILATAFRAKYQRQSAERYGKHVGIQQLGTVMSSESFDRNWNANSVDKVQLEPTRLDIGRLANVMDVGQKLGLLKQKASPEGLVDTTLLRRAVAGLKAAGLDVDKVQYVR